MVFFTQIADLLSNPFMLIKSVFLIIVGIFGIGFLIGFHELGHWAFCKLFKVHTPTFSIGMGPRIFQKKIGDTVFALSAIPLGGYVEIAGAEEVGQGDQKDAKSRDKYSFAVKPYWQKMLILGGGIMFNMIFAYFAFILVFLLGAPKSPILYPMNATTTIKTVIADSAAKKYGLHDGDTILSINGKSFADVEQLIKGIKDIPNKRVKISVERDGAQKTIPVTIGSIKLNGASRGSLGVEFDMAPIKSKTFFGAIKNGIKATNLSIKKTWMALKSIFQDRNIKQVGGPLLVISQTIKSAGKGFKIFLMLLAFISLNLAILNMLPIPIMDGGQALFYTIEAIIRRPLPMNIKLVIHYICWVGIMALMLFLSYKDILRMLGK